MRHPLNPEQLPAKNRPPFFTLSLLISLLAVAYLQFAQWPMPLLDCIEHRDCGVFAYGGWVIAQGGVPYLDFWDQKPPTVFLLNAVAIRLAGMKLVGAWWMSLAALLLSVLLAHATLRAWSRNVRVANWTLLLVSFSFVGVLQAGNSVELYALPLQWVLLLAGMGCLKRSPRRLSLICGVALGVIGGLLFSLRQNEILVFVAMMIALVWQRTAVGESNGVLRLLIGSTTGVLAVFTVMFVYLLHEGALGHFWEQVMIYNFRHKLDATLFQRLDAFGAAIDFLPITLVALGSWLFLLVRTVRAKMVLAFRERLLLTLTPIAFVMVLLSGQRFPHYFISLLPLCGLALAWSLEKIEAFPPLSAKRVQWTARLLVAAFLLLTILKFPHRWQPELDSRQGEVVDFTAETLLQLAHPGDELFIWGMVPELYVESHLPAANRFTHVYPFLSPGYTDSSVVEELLQDFQADPPEWVLDASSHNGRVPSLDAWQPDFRVYGRPLDPSLKRFYAHLAERYAPVDTLTNWKWVLYRPVEGDGVASLR